MPVTVVDVKPSDTGKVCRHCGQPATDTVTVMLGNKMKVKVEWCGEKTREVGSKVDGHD